MTEFRIYNGARPHGSPVRPPRTPSIRTVSVSEEGASALRSLGMSLDGLTDGIGLDGMPPRIVLEAIGWAAGQRAGMKKMPHLAFSCARMSGIVHRAGFARDPAALRAIALSCGHSPPEMFGHDEAAFTRRFLPLYGESEHEMAARAARHMPGFGAWMFGRRGYAWYLNRKMQGDQRWRLFWFLDSERDVYDQTLDEAMDLLECVSIARVTDALREPDDLTPTEVDAWLALHERFLESSHDVLAECANEWTLHVTGRQLREHVCGLDPISHPECTGVYYLRSRGPTDIAVKIGWGKNIRKRIHDLQTAHPWPLELLAYVEGADLRAEGALHQRFRSLRIEDAPGKEWFRLEGSIFEEILRLREGLV